MLDGVPRTLGRPLTAILASATRRATLTGRITPCLASEAMSCRSHDARVRCGWCSAEQRGSQLAQHAWKRMEGRRMERGAAARGVGGLYCTQGRVCDGRCGRLELGCTLLPVSAKARVPDTPNLVEVWVGASTHRIYLVVCTVDMLPTLTNAYWVPRIITSLGTTETRVSSHESGYVNNLQNLHYDVIAKITQIPEIANDFFCGNGLDAAGGHGAARSHTGKLPHR